MTSVLLRMPKQHLRSIMVGSKSYTELSKFQTFAERLNYLMLLDYGRHEAPRSMSMPFYKSSMWQSVREQVLKRDMGYDLGIMGADIFSKLYVHHINPITEEDILTGSDKLLNIDNLITVSHDTHNIIHYGIKKTEEFIERKPGDTILW